jgi:hypothetical protein
VGGVSCSSWAEASALFETKRSGSVELAVEEKHVLGVTANLRSMNPNCFWKRGDALKAREKAMVSNFTVLQL